MAEESESKARRIHWWGITDVGRVRKNNEDAFLALQVDGEGVRRLGKYGESDLAPHDYVFAVSDGMGGANAGEFASRIAVDKITRLFPSVFRTGATGMDVGFQDVLGQLFDEIHKEVSSLGFFYEELRGMGATLSLCWVRPDWVYFAHVGDSRIYHLPASGGIRQISEDHTHVGWKLRQGKISPREARNHPGRHSLQQVIGGNTQHLNPQFGAVGYEPGDQFLMCSDGVVEGLFDSGIQRFVQNPPSYAIDGNPAERVVAEAIRVYGKDNTTAVVVEMT
ncbi:PP2C family protein-serine/threonine phosphatase [Coraliomargarita parva]|uniref:PP2C family protein-serine/threonine phosphatase n=1 Tax=Coraliomargarita parva TaxID=3014050 RepID=UPI0022B5DC4D|nr:protein phosphatase 2C domain-containing protein [Coraliomargarita parva]